MQNSRSVRLPLLLGAGLAVAAPAGAQQASAPVHAPVATGEVAAEEIVVTARKRAESLQDVPVSIAVLSGAKLCEQGLNSIQSLQSVTSGSVVRITPSALPNLSLRGLGTGSVVDSFEQSVAAFLN